MVSVWHPSEPLHVSVCAITGMEITSENLSMFDMHHKLREGKQGVRHR